MWNAAVGYDCTSKAYRYYISEQDKIIFSRDAQFVEKKSNIISEKSIQISEIIINVIKRENNDEANVMILTDVHDSTATTDEFYSSVESNDE